MDDPSLDAAAHLHALSGLRKINRISLAAASIFEPVWALAKRQNLTTLRILDVACGGGDVATAVASRLQKRGIHVELTLLDRSAVALQAAEQTARAAGLDVTAICQDALAPLPDAHFDIITNSLFLHHLNQDQVVMLLRSLRQTAKRAIVISDLSRSRLGWILAWVGCRVLSRSRIVHYDGPVSVEGAWTPMELAQMAQQADMSGTRIAFRWPCRVLLEWYADDFHV